MAPLTRLDSDDTVASTVTVQGSAKTLHTFHFDRFVANENNFRPRDGHRIVEIRQPVKGGDTCLDEYEVPESGLSNWLELVAQARDQMFSPSSADSESMEHRLRLL